jgi:long-chain acyl-CoA synthetase
LYFRIKILNLAAETSEYKNFKLKLIGVFAKNRREWLILDIANIMYDYTMVPFYDTLGNSICYLGPESIPFIL